MERQHCQAEKDLRQLLELCSNTNDKNDQWMQQIEEAYRALAEGTRYVYDQVNANEAIAEESIRSELSTAANTYQSLARDVWQAIIERTNEANERQTCQATQLAWVNDTLSFLGEANMARNQHLANFQGNVELWTAAHQKRVATLEKQLREARMEIQLVATRILLPTTPIHRQISTGQPVWSSPIHPTSTSALSAPPSQPALGSPLHLNPAPVTRRNRRLALPTTPDIRQRMEQLRRPPSPQPPPPEPAVTTGGAPPVSPPGSSSGPPSGPLSEPPWPPFR